MIAINANRPDMAVDLFARAVAVNERSADLRGNFAAALLLLGRAEDAVIQGQRALAIKPDDFSAHNVLGGRERLP